MKTMIIKNAKFLALGLLLASSISVSARTQVQAPTHSFADASRVDGTPDTKAEQILRNCLFDSYYKDKKTWSTYVDELTTHIRANLAYFKQRFGSRVDQFLNELQGIRSSKNIRQIQAVLLNYSEFVSNELNAQILGQKAKIVGLLSMRLR